MVEDATALPIRIVDLSLAEPFPANRLSSSLIKQVPYERKQPASTLLDRLIDLCDGKGSASSGEIRMRAASLLRRRARPLAQKFDKHAWPIPNRQQLETLSSTLMDLSTRHERTYMIYSDSWALPLTLEMNSRLNLDGAGSSELFELILGNIKAVDQA